MVISNLLPTSNVLPYYLTFRLIGVLGGNHQELVFFKMENKQMQAATHLLLKEPKVYS